MNIPFAYVWRVGLALLLLAGPLFAQQMADPDFNASVNNPAYGKNPPRVLFDEAHNNFQMTGRYKPFVDLIENDGYRVVRNREAFTKASLKTFRVLIIVNALGAEEVDDKGADSSAFTDEECDAIRDWVRGGGSLLLISDHKPFGNAAASLSKAIGVDMSGTFTWDSVNHESKFRQSYIVYSRENRLLLEHPITQGRNDGEKINRVIAFAGQSLKGPQGSAAILKLGDTALDGADRQDGSTAPEAATSAAGRAQGIALQLGKGRVVVLGEADMLTALMGEPPTKEPIGMNYPEIDNKQLALNIMHWLSGLL